MNKTFFLGVAASVALSGSALCGEALRPPAMHVLPDGAIQARAWLRHQLELQRDGLTGHAEELYDDIGNSDWLTGAGRGGQYAWERGPYYAKGLVALALALDDAALKAKAKRWVDAILASQRPNGDFGPRERNWWANMIALWLVRDWCAATDDPRVPPFLERYFAFQAQELQRYTLVDESKWAMARGADELDVVLWLHARTGKRSLRRLPVCCRGRSPIGAPSIIAAATPQRRLPQPHRQLHAGRQGTAAAVARQR